MHPKTVATASTTSPGNNELCLQGLSILVVDDDFYTCDLLSFFLGMHGATVTTAPDAAVGLKLFEALHPDLLISDISMPEINGLSLMRQIRALELVPTPAIALTALASEQDRLNSLSVGFQKHVTKPVDPNFLLVEILNLLRLLK